MHSIPINRSTESSDSANWFDSSPLGVSILKTKALASLPLQRRFRRVQILLSPRYGAQGDPFFLFLPFCSFGLIKSLLSHQYAFVCTCPLNPPSHVLIGPAMVQTIKTQAWTSSGHC